LEKSREQLDVSNVASDAGSLRIQFIDQMTGKPFMKGPVLVAIKDATPKNLEILVNALQGHVRRSFPSDNWPKF
jgi:ribosome assembly protein 4